jgi:hypothetical protein
MRKRREQAPQLEQRHERKVRTTRKATEAPPHPLAEERSQLSRTRRSKLVVSGPPSAVSEGVFI